MIAFCSKQDVMELKKYRTRYVSTIMSQISTLSTYTIVTPFCTLSLMRMTSRYAAGEAINISKV